MYLSICDLTVPDDLERVDESFPDGAPITSSLYVHHYLSTVCVVVTVNEQPGATTEPGTVLRGLGAPPA